MSSAAFYQWRSKYGEMDASLISEMKQLQAENARLKRMYADIAMQNKLVKEVPKAPPNLCRDRPTKGRTNEGTIYGRTDHSNYQGTGIW